MLSSHQYEPILPSAEDEGVELQSSFGSALGMEMHDVYEEIENEDSDSDSVGLLESINRYDFNSSWGAVSNLDVFFKRLYAYYQQRGFACILVKELTRIITLLFVIFFSTFLFSFLDWEKLFTCKDEDSCHEFSTYILDSNSHSTLFTLFISLYFVFFVLYWLWTVLSLVPKMKSNWEMRQFYFKYLYISSRDLQTMEWSTVIDRLMKLQASGKYRIQIHSDTFSAKDMTQRIMRKQNYLVALMNHEILPFGSSLCGSNWYFGKHLEKMLEVTVLDQLFDEQFSLRRDFVNEPWKLRKRFIQFGVANLLFLPFTLLFYMIYFFLKYAQEFHSKQNYLGPRWYSPYALWQFREFNELPHYFDSRVCASVKHADNYIKQFPTPVMTAIAGGISFIAGSFVAVLLVFTFMEDNILLHITLFNRNLLWYFAILSGVVALSRSFIPAVEDTKFYPKQLMRRVIAYSHFMPARWRERVHTYDVMEEFSSFYQYKVVLLFREIACLFATPFVLCFVLPKHAERIVQFISEHTTFIDGVGDVCVFSELNIEAHGNPLFGGNASGSVTRNGKTLKFHTFDGKLEKSWLNFYTKYGGLEQQDLEGGKDLMKRLQRFQKEQLDRQIVGADSSFSSNHAFEEKDNSGIKSQNSSALFGSTNSMSLPLDQAKFENSENYFYWLEEYRNAGNR